MKSNPHIELIAFVLDKAASEPVLKRVSLYRGLADFSGDKEEGRKLNAMADALQSADKLCCEFNFNFIQQYTDKMRSDR